MKYSIDTSSLIHAWRRAYPPDNFPSVWQKIEAAIDIGTLRATDEVRVEIEKKDDDLHKWTKERKHLFVPLDDEIQQIVTQLLAVYPGLINVQTNRSGADPFVIALAKKNACAVVNNEFASNKPAKPKIPDVCQKMGLRTLTVLEMIQAEGWTF